jgi:hypothetical protein
MRAELEDIIKQQDEAATAYVKVAAAASIEQQKGDLAIWPTWP